MCSKGTWKQSSDITSGRNCKELGWKAPFPSTECRVLCAPNSSGGSIPHTPTLDWTQRCCATLRHRHRLTPCRLCLQPLFASSHSESLRHLGTKSSVLCFSTDQRTKSHHGQCKIEDCVSPLVAKITAPRELKYFKMDTLTITLPLLNLSVH